MHDEAENIIHLARPKSSLLDTLDRMQAGQESKAKPEPEPKPEGEARPEANADAGESLVSPEELAPLPQSGDAYVAHSRTANRPLATIFFLPKGGLPDGFSYASFERVRLVESERPGVGPALLVRFNGSVIYEVTIEGRNLLGLCNLIGRHLIHWVREHPTGSEGGEDRSVFIRRIVIREVERR